jgi:hypothetical protein
MLTSSNLSKELLTFWTKLSKKMLNSLIDSKKYDILFFPTYFSLFLVIIFFFSLPLHFFSRELPMTYIPSPFFFSFLRFESRFTQNINFANSSSFLYLEFHNTTHNFKHSLQPSMKIEQNNSIYFKPLLFSIKWENIYKTH